VTSIANAKGEVTNYLGIATDLSRLKNQEQQLEKITHYDKLTGIANRTLLADRMDHALSIAKRDDSLIGICYLDLDGFKPINDDFGHLVGDKILVEIARRILGVVRGTDTVARLGGDEFAVLLVGLHRVEECTAILENLLQTISQPVFVDDRDFTIKPCLWLKIWAVIAIIFMTWHKIN
jgi:diguanylate cyclase (GGDEF)-like protein